MNYRSAIDVSHLQGDIDFTKVATAGVKQVFIKATEGATVQDACYVKNRKNARSAGIKTGAYHYYHATSSTPREQRDNIVSVLTSAGFDSSSEYFAIDVEYEKNTSATAEQMADNLYLLTGLLEKEDILGGNKPLIYTSSYDWNTYVSGNDYNFFKYPLWIAEWNVSVPVIPEPWASAGKKFTIWQHSASGQVDGILGNVDLDSVNLDSIYPK